MKLNKIENKLKEIGYITQIHDSIGSLTLSLSNENREPKFGTTSRVELIDNKFKYTYYSGQLPIETNFTKEEELIDFIKEKYPIEE